MEDKHRRLPPLEDGERPGRRKILCEIVDFDSGDKWTDFAIETSYMRKRIADDAGMYRWSDKMYEVREAVACTCPERFRRRQTWEDDAGQVCREKWHKCEDGWDLRGRRFLMEWDGFNWERVRIKKSKRCKLG
ncbi:hypothetical protein TW95_gp0058 [Pandoravirus inopinatum]|uniref:Uncharacterized protein n=1 Tax=Pandoravirus inopinatum TaxID=1605721 RepID=A0A0B5JB68_9VIRU|nr:hypothetical protein TW95_gp0058 [Pandoravirus inopinatum]AJF96792.1 hypothetical protein [Pandoravirus inopinatum]